ISAARDAVRWLVEHSTHQFRPRIIPAMPTRSRRCDAACEVTVEAAEGSGTEVAAPVADKAAPRQARTRCLPGIAPACLGALVSVFCATQPRDAGEIDRLDRLVFCVGRLGHDCGPARPLVWWKNGPLDRLTNSHRPRQRRDGLPPPFGLVAEDDDAGMLRRVGVHNRVEIVGTQFPSQEFDVATLPCEEVPARTCAVGPRLAPEPMWQG